MRIAVPPSALNELFTLEEGLQDALQSVFRLRTSLAVLGGFL